MGLYEGRSGSQLTINDALVAGYRFLLNPNFSIPILVIGVIVNWIAVVLIVPAILGIVVGSQTDAVIAIGAIVGSLLGIVITAVVGGVILNLYGQVWATMASEGTPPQVSAAFGRVAERWLNILGAGLIVGVIEIGALIVIGLVAAALGAVGAIVFLVGLVATVFVGIRLSLAGWFAADGDAAVEAVRASWDATDRHMTTVIVWSIVIGIVVGLITFVAGIVLDLVPIIGHALTSTLGSAFGFGAGVTLFHRIKDA